MAKIEKQTNKKIYEVRYHYELIKLSLKLRIIKFNFFYFFDNYFFFKKKKQSNMKRKERTKFYIKQEIFKNLHIFLKLKISIKSFFWISKFLLIKINKSEVLKIFSLWYIFYRKDNYFFKVILYDLISDSNIDCLNIIRFFSSNFIEEFTVKNIQMAFYVLFNLYLLKKNQNKNYFTKKKLETKISPSYIEKFKTHHKGLHKFLKKNYIFQNIKINNRYILFYTTIQNFTSGLGKILNVKISKKKKPKIYNHYFFLKNYFSNHSSLKTFFLEKILISIRTIVFLIINKITKNLFMYKKKKKTDFSFLKHFSSFEKKNFYWFYRYFSQFKTFKIFILDLFFLLKKFFLCIDYQELDIILLKISDIILYFYFNNLTLNHIKSTDIIREKNEFFFAIIFKQINLNFQLRKNFYFVKQKFFCFFFLEIFFKIKSFSLLNRKFYTKTLVI